MRRRAALVLAIAVAIAGASARATLGAGPERAAVFDVGDRAVRARVGAALGAGGLVALDAGLVDAAARGAGYAGSLNLTLEETRRLATTVGARVLVLGTVSIVERETDNANERWDAFVGLFLADGASGRLLRYRGFRATAPDRPQALDRVLAAVDAEVRSWGDIWRAAEARREQGTLEPAWDLEAVDLVASPEGGAGLIPPRFFKRPAPGFTDDADRVHAVATVDLLVQFNADGSYGPVEVVRWAGLGLDEAAENAVRSCRFWPARRDGRLVPARALLRYNFRFRDR